MCKRITERVLSLLLVGWLLLNLTAPVAWAAPAGTASESAMEDTLSISTLKELQDFAKSCSLDAWSRGKTVRLVADLDLSSLDFAPIPTFGGTFLGQGHTISGLQITAAGSNQGLFRYLQPGGVIQDLHVVGAVLPEGARSAVGGIVGVNGGAIQNCTFQGTVRGKSAVGGIAGRNSESGEITGCTVSGSVSGESAVGGVAGRNLGILLKCENNAGVNLTEAGSAAVLNFTGLEAGTVLGQQAASDEEGYHLLSGYSDTGGIVGWSGGVVQSCINNGTVGYPHVGYNTGGIAGRQSGYLAGCINTGSVYGRKDVGGIVGQAEPYLAVEPGQDTLDRLRTELDTLDSLINRALDDAQRTGDGVSARLTAMGDYADGARDSAKRLLDRTSDFVDENVNTLNTLTADITNALDRMVPALDSLADAGGRLERLSGSLGDALESLGDAADIGGDSMEKLRAAAAALRQSGAALKAAADNLSQALEALLKGVISKDEQARAAALDQVRAGIAALENALSANAGAVAALRTALAEVDDLPAVGETLPTLDDLRASLEEISEVLGRIEAILPASPEDWETVRTALRGMAEGLQAACGKLEEALAALQAAVNGAASASGKLGQALRDLRDVSTSAGVIGRLLRDAFQTIGKALDGLTENGPVEFSPLGDEVRQAGDSLYDAMAGLSGEMETLNDMLQEGGDAVTADLRAVSRQFRVVFDVFADTVTDLWDDADTGLDSLIQDTSDEDISATREGKVTTCRNTGAVEGDRNVGGLAGAVAIEFDLDPEDDVTDRISFGTTYETKAVLQDCLNRGTVTAKKDCVGGLVGRMDLGTALGCENYGAVASTDGDYVGGIVGYTDGIVRECYAKNTLSGKNYVGGIAGWASHLQSCWAIATVEAGVECVGAVAGGVDAGGILFENRFVDTGLAGVDGVSYAGHAEPAPFEVLSRLPEVPAEFTAFTLTLLAEEETVAKIPFFYGDDLSRIDLPEVPAREGSYGEWPVFDTSGLRSDITLEAEYAPWVTLVASREAEGKLVLALAEGRFTDKAVLHVTQSTQSPPQESGEQARVWDVSLTGTDLGGGDTVPLRLLIPGGGSAASVWQYLDGQWQQVETGQNRRYLLLSMTGTEGTFCIQPASGNLMPVLLIAAAAVLLAALLLAWKRRLKKRRTAKAATAPAEQTAETVTK